MPNSPRTPGAVTSSTSVVMRAPIGVVIERCMGPGSALLGHLLGARAHLVQAAHHVERLLRDVVALAVDDLLEAAHGVLDLDVFAGRAGEGLGDVERLGEE